MIDCEVKGIITRGGKTMTQDAQNNDGNVHTEEPHTINHDKPVESDEVLTNDQPQKARIITRGGKTMTQDAQNNDGNVHTEEPHTINHDKPVESDEVLTNDQPQKASIKVDRAKINVIAKLSYPTNIKGVRNFLGHAGFYQRFIKDFSLISKQMTKLLMKDTKFDFSNNCKKVFNILKEKLTTAPIIISPDWNVSFEMMCDASDFAVGAVLGHKVYEKFKPIYYTIKTPKNAQEHYTTTEKELLAVVFSFDKFRPYLFLSKTIVYIDHSTLKYLFSKQDAKPRLIRWVLLLQGFEIEIKDKRGAKNLAANHLSRLENLKLSTFTEEEITDEFLDEHLMALKTEI
nr:reverse transcriptase domain-containing protein [Tanacetum cinerariifolium]